MAINVGTVAGIEGEAEVFVTNQGTIRLTMVEGGKRFEIFKDDAPNVPDTVQKAFVKLNAEGTKIWSIAPLPGTCFVKLLKFSSKENEPPIPWMSKERMFEKGGQKGIIKPQLMFTVQYIVTSGPNKGLTCSMSVPYAFKPWTEGAETPVAQIAGQGVRKLEEWLRINGIDFVQDSIPFSENILPALEKMLLPRAKTLIAEVGKRGWINSLMAAPEG